MIHSCGSSFRSTVCNSAAVPDAGGTATASTHLLPVETMLTIRWPVVPGSNSHSWLARGFGVATRTCEPSQTSTTDAPTGSQVNRYSQQLFCPVNLQTPGAIAVQYRWGEYVVDSTPFLSRWILT